MMLQSGDILDNRYQLDTVLFEGRTDIIWRAYDKHLERDVALKTLRNQERVLRIRHEALTSGSLEHPHLIPIYDYSIESKPPYLVMQIVPNLRLTDLIESRQLSSHEILRFAQRIGDTLDYLHENKIVHGDFRPDNILVGVQNQPYITNLSVSTTIDASGMAVNVGMGSRYYMAPEQFSSARVDYRADIYSFGLILYQLITGQLPFGMDGEKSYFAMKQEIDPLLTLPSIRTHRPELPIGFDLVLNRLTRFSVEERYNSASDAVKDLERAFYSGQSSVEGKVFISYSTRDKDYVHKFAAELLSIGIDIWIDLNIHQGSDWGDAIEDALKVCDMMLLITTGASMDSAYVNHEWSYFMGLGKPVYPFVPATELPENIHPRLNRLQLVQGTGDMLADIANVVSVLAGGNPKQLGGLDE